MEWTVLVQYLSKFKRRKQSSILLLVFVLFLQLLGFCAYTYLSFCTEDDYDLDEFDDTYEHLEVQYVDASKFQNEENVDLPLCSEYPTNLVGIRSRKNEDHKLLPWDDILSANPKILKGGRFSPENCRARSRVAILIPLRGRESQLQVLLSYMHPIWQTQEIDYTVYTITQAGNQLFNRAKLINTGVAEALKDRSYDCFVFHDVDLLLENDKCLYWCDNENPRHLAMYMDKFSYKPLTYWSPCAPIDFRLPKIMYFGGVSMMSKDQFMKVNGFSNFYWGWGGEDDDVFFRLSSKEYTVSNPYGNYCSYHMIHHEHESSNAENGGRYALLHHSTPRMEKEGFSTLKYKIVSKDLMPLYTNITVDIGQPKQKMLSFISSTTSWVGSCLTRMPWC